MQVDLAARGFLTWRAKIDSFAAVPAGCRQIEVSEYLVDGGLVVEGSLYDCLSRGLELIHEHKASLVAA